MGNGCRSTSVIEVSLNCGLLQSAHAVESPKTPLPTMRIDEGISGAIDAIAMLKENGEEERDEAEDKEIEELVPTCVRLSTTKLWRWSDIVEGRNFDKRRLFAGHKFGI